MSESLRQPLVIIGLAEDAEWIDPLVEIDAMQGVERILLEEVQQAESVAIDDADRTYSNVAQWAIDDDWIEVVSRTVRLSADESMVEELRELASLAAHALIDWDAIRPIFVGRAAAVGALLCPGPYLQLQPGHLSLEGSARVGAAHAESTVYIDYSFAVIGEFSVFDDSDVEASRALGAAGIVPAFERHADKSARHESLRQLRWELWYEAESVDTYDDKYHSGECYVDLDRTLAQLLGEHLPDRPTRRILDLGCGPGSMIPFLQEIPNVEIVGLDIAPAMIRRAREQYPNVEFQIGTSDLVPFDDASFDAVLISGMLHHLPGLFGTLTEVRRVLRPDGVFVAREPNDDNFAARHRALAAVHQAVRSLYFDVTSALPVYEPDAHDDHIDFTPAVLAQGVAQLLRVDRIETHSPIGYFYDRLAGDDYEAIRELEQSLSDQPGLNLMLVATPNDPGLSPEAEAQLQSFSQMRAVPLVHYELLSERLHSLLAQRRKLPQFARNQSIDTRLAALEGVHRATTDDEISRSSNVEPLYPLVTSRTSSASFHRALAGVAEHGWLAIDVDSAVPAEGTEFRAMPCVALELTGERPRLLARPGAIAPIDALESLRVAIDVARGSFDYDSHDSKLFEQQKDRATEALTIERLTSEPTSFDERNHLASLLVQLNTSLLP